MRAQALGGLQWDNSRGGGSSCSRSGLLAGRCRPSDGILNLGNGGTSSPDFPLGGAVLGHSPSAEAAFEDPCPVSGAVIKASLATVSPISYVPNLSPTLCVHNLLCHQAPGVSNVLCHQHHVSPTPRVPNSLCSQPHVSSTSYHPTPCVPNHMSPTSFVQTSSAPMPLCPQFLVSSTSCVTNLLCPQTLVSLASCDFSCHLLQELEHCLNQQSLHCPASPNVCSRWWLNGNINIFIHLSVLKEAMWLCHTVRETEAQRHPSCSNLGACNVPWGNITFLVYSAWWAPELCQHCERDGMGMDVVGMDGMGMDGNGHCCCPHRLAVPKGRVYAFPFLAPSPGHSARCQVPV